MVVRTEVYRADWRRGRFASWVTTVDHKRIGLLYIGTSLVFFAAGGLLAVLMRAQLAQADEHFITRHSYNELFTIHGTTMIFLFIVPFWAGLANYLVPLMIGARDMAFPRLNALSYWLFLFGGITLFLSFFADGGAASAGWYSYPTLSESFFPPGHGQDLGILSLHLVDPQAGAHSFLPADRGNAVLYQPMFWFFGHPEVYVIILPAMGVILEVIPVFSRKPIFGYKAIAFSTVAIGFYPMLVWAHHMFSVGMPNFLNVFFMLSSMVIAVPTGVKIFNWIATTWRGNLIFDTAMLWALGFVAEFTIGGLSGISLAAFPVDWQVTDTYYVVAHMHYVLFGGAVFGIFAAIFYWWPKIFGRLLDETLGKAQF